MIGPVKIRDLGPAETRRLMNRNSLDLDAAKDAVERIVFGVRDRGDQAVAEYTEQFDKVAMTPDCFKIQKSDITQAMRTLPRRLVLALRVAAANIEDIHRRQLPRDRCLKNRGGVTVWELCKPLGCVGIYVPGGRAAYPSTALMLSIPARVAGVKRIVACTPPREDGSIHPATLAALHIGGVAEVYRIGGAQAIAAMAYGTKNIPRVDKVVGPGNIYVATAKMR
ncbi:MAG: histidinol dehydrogenase, partial [Candidatus Bathyarchaeia archaeon]